MQDGSKPEYGIDLRQPPWERVASFLYLDAVRSSLPWRAFFAPNLSSRRNTFAEYIAVRRGKKISPLP